MTFYEIRPKDEKRNKKNGDTIPFFTVFQRLTIN